MNNIIKAPVRHMLQGLAHWMAYRNEMSNIQLIEADAILVASDLLRANLPKDYVIEREVTKTSLPILNKQRIDLGIKSKSDGLFKCLIEFKLADATNKGYVGDVDKLTPIKQQDNSIDCLVVMLYRKPCLFTEPHDLVDIQGKARRGVVKVGKNNIFVKVRHVCSSFSSSKISTSKKTICLELL